MNRSIEWFAKNPVAANLLMVAILFAGGLSLMTSRQEVFPELALDMITISVNYLGAAPEEVEEGVCMRIEEAIAGLDGVKRMTSSATENVGTVVVELRTGIEPEKVLRDIKTRIDAIETFPAETEKPIIRELTSRYQVVDLVISGETDRRSLENLARRIREEVIDLEGITTAEVVNSKPREITVEVSEQDLRMHQLTFDQVANAVRSASLDLPGGVVKTAGGEILLRTRGQAKTGPEFEKIPLLTKSDGTRLLLGDVARVIDGFAETDQASTYNGKPSMTVQVYRVGEQNAVQIADKVKAYVVEAQQNLPDGIAINVLMDQTKILKDRLSLLARNGLSGLLMVFLLLALFLKLRLALWVAMGIPIAFMGAFWIMPFFDVSINLVSLFAFIVVLGIVVDDAIVVGESIYLQQEKTGDGLKGAIKGAHEVAVPVTFGVLTTVMVFVPMLTLEGVTGKFFRQLPIVVIGCLLFSFIESKFILPRHLSQLKVRTENPNGWQRLQGGFARMLTAFVQKIYKPFLEKAIRWRYLTLACAVAFFLFTVGFLAADWVKFNYMDNVESDMISVSITMPQGTPPERTAQAIEQLNRGAQALAAELEAEGKGDVFRNFFSTIGSQPYKQAQDFNAGNYTSNYSAGNLGEVTVELSPSEERDGVSSEKLAIRWRELTGDIPEALEVAYTASLFTPGKDLEVQLTADNLEMLREASLILKAELSEINGVFDISDTYRRGKREVQLSMKPAAETWGITLSDLGRQVRQAFYGEEAQRVQRGQDDIRVMVRYPESERRSLGDLENMRVRTISGMEAPFNEVAEYTQGRGYASITRVDRERSLNVTAAVDKQITSPGAVISLLQSGALAQIHEAYPQIGISFEGQTRQQKETMDGLWQGFLLAMFVMYALLAIPLKSYFQPVLIMTAIPFGLVGAIWGHVIMGFDLSILSFMGIVALSGVVVNDSLVMVDFINRRARSGHSIMEAIREAGAVRFRPILLTSLTTFVGLMPLLLEKSLQARFLVPMAVSLAFGVLFSTAISLVLIPVCYGIYEDVKAIFFKIVRFMKPKKHEADDTRIQYEPDEIPSGNTDATPI